MATLADYRADVRRLLHDPQGTYWSDTDLDAFINRAVRQRDLDSGQNRSLQTITLNADQSVYTITATPFSTRTAGVIGVVVLHGNARWALGRTDYSTLSSKYQSFTTFRQRPVVYAARGAHTIVVAPTPDQNYTSEWDTVVYAADLVNPGDADPLPFPWTDPVPFLAAHFAKTQLQQHDEAQLHLQMYYQRMNWAAGGSYGTHVAAPYAR